MIARTYIILVWLFFRFHRARSLDFIGIISWAHFLLPLLMFASTRAVQARACSKKTITEKKKHLILQSSSQKTSIFLCQVTATKTRKLYAFLLNLFYYKHARSMMMPHTHALNVFKIKCLYIRKLSVIRKKVCVA